MLSIRLVLRLRHTALACHIARNKAMHQKVGITADRRSKVSVVLKSQAVVTDIFCTVLGTSHRAYSHGLDECCLRLILRSLDHGIEVLANGASLSSVFELVAKTTNERPHLIQFIPIREVMDTVYKGLGVPITIALLLAKLGSNRPIGKEHKLLN